jgi:hypothetical protein
MASHDLRGAGQGLPRYSPNGFRSGLQIRGPLKSLVLAFFAPISGKFSKRKIYGLGQHQH